MWCGFLPPLEIRTACRCPLVLLGLLAPLKWQTQCLLVSVLTDKGIIPPYICGDSVRWMQEIAEALGVFSATDKLSAQTDSKPLYRHLCVPPPPSLSLSLSARLASLGLFCAVQWGRKPVWESACFFGTNRNWPHHKQFLFLLLEQCSGVTPLDWTSAFHMEKCSQNSAPRLRLRRGGAGGNGCEGREWQKLTNGHLLP